METEVLTLTKEQKLVKEIHGAFDAEADMIVEEAMQMLRGKYTSQLKAKAERLVALGFRNASDVKEWRKREQDLEKYNLVMEYKVKYPFQKFITKEQLDKLCKKYSLVYAPVSKYIGDIPLKNLKEIEEAKKRHDDLLMKDTALTKRERLLLPSKGLGIK
jgi:hypothetical protein